MSKSGDLIYRPKGKAGEYAPFAFNGYTGCDHNCDYCFNKRGIFAHDWTNRAVLRKPFGGSEDTAFQMFQKEALAKHHVLRNAGVMFSFKTDPCLHGTWKLTWSCASFCLSAGIPVSILTKAVDWCYDRYDYPELDGAPAKGMAAYLLGLKEARDMLSVGFTLTGHDEMEPNAPSNLERIEALAKIHAMGIRTYVSIEPVIDCRASIDMIRRSLPFVDLLKIGLRSGVPQKYYDDGELLAFVQNVNELLERIGNVKVYWKRTFRERLASRGGGSLFNTAFSVGADYKLFKIR